MFYIMVGVFIAVLVSGLIMMLSDFKQKIPGITAGVAIILVSVGLASFTVISAGHTGVQVTLGEVNPLPLTEGVHFVNPISQIKDVDVRLQKAELKGANAGTKDLQVVHTDIVVNFRLDPLKVNYNISMYYL